MTVGTMLATTIREDKPGTVPTPGIVREVGSRMTPNPKHADRRGSRVDLAADVLDVVAAIRARAQLTRRRLARVDELSRDHIGADLAQIEAQAERLARLILPLQGDADVGFPANPAATSITTRRPRAPRPGRPRRGVRPGRTA